MWWVKADSYPKWVHDLFDLFSASSNTDDFLFRCDWHLSIADTHSPPSAAEHVVVYWIYKEKCESDLRQKSLKKIYNKLRLIGLSKRKTVERFIRNSEVVRQHSRLLWARRRAARAYRHSSSSPHPFIWLEWWWNGKNVQAFQLSTRK